MQRFDENNSQISRLYKEILFENQKFKDSAFLKRLQLSSCQLIKSEFSNVELVATSFRKSKIQNCIFVECDFSRVVFSDCEFIDCKFDNCKFSFSQLGNGLLNSCEFVNCEFARSSITGVDIVNVDFLESRFNKSRITANKFNESKFAKTIVNDSVFNSSSFINTKLQITCTGKNNFTACEMTMMDFSKVSFVGVALFISTNLQGAIFNGVRSNGLNFFEANLNGAKILNSALTKAQFQNAKLESADVVNTSFSYCNFKDTTFSQANCQNNRFDICNLSGADFSDVELAKNYFNYGNLHDVKTEQNLKKIKTINNSRYTDVNRKKQRSGAMQKTQSENAKLQIFEQSTTTSSNYAIVTLEKDDSYFIKYNGGLRVAKKAVSCLLKPQKNDVVDVKVVDDDIYIVAILDRVNESQADIELPNNTKISVKGELSIEAQKLKQTALYYEMCANEAVNIVHSLKSFVNDCYQYSDFNQQKAAKLMKEITEFEQNVVEDMRTVVNKNFRVDAKSADIITEEDTVINAKSVSLG